MNDLDTNNHTMEKEQGLGDFLKSGRKQKGLSQEDMAGATRVRSHFIHALENEDWENLPSPVFVKGFIRSYAKVLDLDFAKVLALYERSGPKREESPHPLITPEKPKRNFKLFIILLVVAVTILTYLWISYPKIAEIAPETSVGMKSEEKVPEESTVLPDQAGHASEPEADLHINGEIPGTPEEALTERQGLSIEENDTAISTDIQVEHVDVEPEDSPVNEGNVISDTDAMDAESDVDEGAVEPETDDFTTFDPDVSDREGPENAPGEELIAEQPVVFSEPVPEEMPDVSENGQVTFPLMLTGIVSLRTYVKIYIDDKPPKEYIFKPGSRPQWEAMEGFNIIVGNAAGIVFSFNGNVIQNLGKPGKVVHLNLPEDFKSKLYED